MASGNGSRPEDTIDVGIKVVGISCQQMGKLIFWCLVLWALLKFLWT